MFTESGKIHCGCNYWASHAGILMWRNWSQETVEEDFQRLSRHGVTLLRVFPLWEDFQPVETMRAGAGVPAGYAAAGTNAPLFPGDDGLDPVMMQKFRTLADLAQKYHLKLIVGLLTGWMSGRLFVPRMLEGRNLFTDPEAMRWESRFIRGFVNAFKDHPAIAVWEPGNECNCLASLPAGPEGEAAAWHWLDFIVNSIRSADPLHPVWSGMHGTPAEPDQPWNLHALGECCDGMTTHPYPLFTPHCGKSPLNTTPAVYHSTAETLFYRGISGKPCIVEEIGTLGPGLLSENRRCKYVRTTVASAWAHDCLAYLWWCAFDQDHLTYAPYRNVALERELGLFSHAGVPHPAATELARTLEKIKALPFDTLPPRKIHALVLTTEDQDSWLAAYGSFVLGKQAGLEVEFASACKKIPDADFYWMPAISGFRVLDLPRWQELQQKVREGATLLVTDDGSGILQPFASVFGCEVDYSTTEPEEYQLELADESFALKRNFTRRLLPGKAEISGTIDGTPGLIRNEFGKGQIFYLNGAPELQVLQEKQPHLYKIYRSIAMQSGLDLPAKHPGISRTEHLLPDGRTVMVKINCTDCDAEGIAANDFTVDII